MWSVLRGEARAPLIQQCTERKIATCTVWFTYCCVIETWHAHFNASCLASCLHIIFISPPKIPSTIATNGVKFVLCSLHSGSLPIPQA
eukprot:415958-Ditylum_brightwellii.AAC.1